MAAFLLKGRHDGCASLSFTVVPSISPPPELAFIYLCVWPNNTRLKQKKTKTKTTFHHKDLSLPHINKAYDPDLNVPLLLIVLRSHRKKIEENQERK